MTSKKIFSSSQAIKFGWENFKKNFWFFIEIMLLWMGLEIILSQLETLVPENAVLLSILSFLVGWFIELGFILGVCVIVLKVIKGEKPFFGDLFTRHSFTTLKTFLIISSFLTLPIILLSIWEIFSDLGVKSDGIRWSISLMILICETILMVRFGFAGFLLLEKKSKGAIEALKLSWRMTKTQWNSISLFVVILLGFNLLGAALFGAGLLITVPVSVLAYGYVYSKFAS